MAKDKKYYFEVYKHLDIILLMNKYNYTNTLYKFTNMSYSTLNKRINFLITSNIITRINSGRIKFFVFTDKGTKILNKLLELNEILDKQMEEK